MDPRLADQVCKRYDSPSTSISVTAHTFEVLSAPCLRSLSLAHVSFVPTRYVDIAATIAQYGRPCVLHRLHQLSSNAFALARKAQRGVIDGGLSCNNPIKQVLEEAEVVFGPSQYVTSIMLPSSA
jgi:hypothetical protein